MASVFNYVDYYNYSFLEKPFNEVDNLIFSRLVYVEFESILLFSERMNLREAYQKYMEQEPIIYDKDTITLWEKMIHSKRYQNVILGNYISLTSDSLEKQFAAITFYLPDHSCYISFRGTDRTLIGMKEDFNMTYMPHIPSQKDSVKYLEMVAEKSDDNIRVGGHSKGGNMAMYSAIFCKPKYRDRILWIYNNDGPGFFDEIIESKNYKEILDRVSTYVPQSSVIGMLLNHKEKYTVVKSTKRLINQHDLISWEVEEDHFVTLDSVNKKSKYIDDIMSRLLLISDEEKKQFFEIIYHMLISTGAKTTQDLSKEKMKNIKEMLTNYKNLTEEEKKVFLGVWKEIIRIAKVNLPNYLPKKKKDGVV